MKNIFGLLLVTVALAALAAGPALAVTQPPAAIMAPINAAVDAVNSENPAATKGLYTTDAVVVDEFAPFSWSGTNAGAGWIGTLQTMSAQQHITDVRGVLHPAASFSIQGNSAYASFPTDVHFTLNGKPQVEHGTFAFTLRKEGDGWKIVTQTWGTLSSG